MASIVTTEHRQILADFNKRLLAAQNPSDRFYFTISRNTEWDDELAPDTPVDTQEQVNSFRKDIIAIKRVEPISITHVMKRTDWLTGTIYDEYDSSIDQHETDAPFAVMTDEYNVYKCIKTAKDDTLEPQPSTVKPTGTSQNIIETADGYKWKYMATLSSGEVFDFLTSEWIPIKTILTNDGSDQFVVQTTAIEGTIDNVIVDAIGSGYSDINPPVLTISGDGTGATADAVINVAGELVDVTVTARGSGYTYATITIDDTANGNNGSGASVRAVISPLGGHGSDPVRELSPGALMFNVRLIRDEDGNIPVDDDYRQLGIIHNPTETTSGTKLSITADVDGDYSAGETVTGNSSGFAATVHAWDSAGRLLYLSGVSGVPVDGETVTGSSSGTTGTNADSDTVKLPAKDLVYSASEVDKYSGKLTYFENRLTIARDTDQTEQLRTVIQY